MYDLSFHARWLLAAVFFALPCCPRGLSAIDTAAAAGRKERSAGLLVARGPEVQTTLDSQGQAYLAAGAPPADNGRGDYGQAQGLGGTPPTERGRGDEEDHLPILQHLLRDNRNTIPKDWVRVQAQFYLHPSDGITFSEKMPAGTLSGNTRCTGVTHCQFQSFLAAKLFCSNHGACNGILQQTDPGLLGADHSGCEGDFGCFYPAKGHLLHDDDWKRLQGKTYERQVLAYNRFKNGRKLNDLFAKGTRGCGGVAYCQYPTLKPALDFCDLDAECLGVLKMPVSVHGGTEDCKGGKGCYAPAKGTLFHDPLWRDVHGETYLKEQEVAYFLREGDGMIYTGRFAAGTSGCPGVHNCQFMTLEDAEAYCDANPTCRGIVEKPVGLSNGQHCDHGLGCFLPAKGNLKYDLESYVTEGKIYSRR